MFTGHGRKREGHGERQDAGPGECAQFGASAHQDEENWHQERSDWIDELVQRVLTALHEVAVVQVLENQPGAEGADDGREPERRGKPGQEEAERQTGREQGAACFQLRR